MLNSLYTYILNIWFGWVGFYSISTIINIWFGLIGFYSISTIINIWFGLIGFYSISTIINIWFGWVGFYSISTIYGQILFKHIYWIYMIWLCSVLWYINYWWFFNAKSSLYIYIYILNTYDLVVLGFWHINHCRLSIAKSFLYIYIMYIWLGFVWFYAISTIVDYLMPNILYTYVNIFCK